PVIEMTALPGPGDCRPPDEEGEPPPELDGVLPPDDEPELEPPLVSSPSCWANGSLLANRLNDASCPSCAGGGTSPLVSGLAAGVVLDACSEPPSVGAARLGVPVDDVVVVGVAATAGFWLRCFITRGNAQGEGARTAHGATLAVMFCVSVLGV